MPGNRAFVQCLRVVFVAKTAAFQKQDVDALGFQFQRHRDASCARANNAHRRVEVSIALKRS